jgi:hypothetical protein
MSSSRVAALIGVAGISLLALVLLAWYQLSIGQHAACDTPPSTLVDWLARDLWLATTHNAKVPLSRLCRNEMANLILLLADIRQADSETMSVETVERRLYDALGIESSLSDVKLMIRALDAMKRDPRMRDRIALALDQPLDEPLVERREPSGDKSAFSRSVIYAAKGAVESAIELPLEDRFSIVVQTFYNGTRLPRLLDTLKRLSSMAEIDRVILWWNDAEHGTPPPSLALFDEAALRFPVIVELPERNSLNNRYRLSPHIRTAAVLAMDDDLRPTPLQLRFAFEQWKVQPQRLVGFTPRHFAVKGADAASLDWLHAELHGAATTTRAPPPLGVVADNSGANALHYRFGGCPASVVLHPFFTHRDHLARFWSEPMAPVRNIVDEHMNGEELSFNMVTTSATGLPPLVVASSIARVDSDGGGGAAVSNSVGHYERRVWVTRHVAAELARLRGAAVPPLINTLAVTVLCDAHSTDADNAALQADVGAPGDGTLTRGGAGWLALQDAQRSGYIASGDGKFNV